MLFLVVSILYKQRNSRNTCSKSLPVVDNFGTTSSKDTDGPWGGSSWNTHGEH